MEYLSIIVFFYKLIIMDRIIWYLVVNVKSYKQNTS